MARGMAGDPARDDMLVLVDGLDRTIGEATKWEAHEKGLLHRALSVVLVREAQGEDADGYELLLSRRALGKYHSGGLWANSCCSHPRVGEDVMDAAYRRVHEELGCTAVALWEACAFAYRAVFDNGLTEHEFDHVFIGRLEGALEPDAGEVDAVRWVGFTELASELAGNPAVFAAWAPMVLSIAMKDVLRNGIA